MTEDAADDPRGWIALAQTFYFEKHYQAAYDPVVSKITRFPKHWPLYCDAACYARLTGRLEQAKQFLQLAMAFGKANELKRLALDDPDLEQIWKSGPQPT